MRIANVIAKVEAHAPALYLTLRQSYCLLLVVVVVRQILTRHVDHSCKRRMAREFLYDTAMNMT